MITVAQAECEGVGALYRGITITLLRGAPNAGIPSESRTRNFLAAPC